MAALQTTFNRCVFFPEELLVPEKLLVPEEPKDGIFIAISFFTESCGDHWVYSFLRANLGRLGRDLGRLRGRLPRPKGLPPRLNCLPPRLKPHLPRPDFDREPSEAIYGKPGEADRTPNSRRNAGR